jgi:lycopene epsilon-cyclase
MSFDLLKKRLMYRLNAMGIRILKVYEEVRGSTILNSHTLYSENKLKCSRFKEWSYIPVGGSLPNTDQKNLAFGAAASMVHPATGTYESSIFCTPVSS